MMLGAKMTGDKELAAKFSSLPGRLQKGALRRGVTKGARIVTKSAGGGVTKRTGLLKKSLGQRVKTFPSGVVFGIVGARRGFRVLVSEFRNRGGALGLRKTVSRSGVKFVKVVLKSGRGLKIGQYIDPAKYSHLVERGHRKGRGRSAARPRPFLDPAWKTTRKEVTRSLHQEVLAEVAKK